MTIEEQIAIINDPAFRDAIQARVLRATAALEGAGIAAPEISWVEQDVKVRLQFEAGNSFVRLNIGEKSDGTPVFDWRAPVRWFEHRTP
jgi:hypothetical protein